ncbi:hypothetical protein [Methylocystis echinoides]|uniref:Uncharacterized protein n=1 Tax=Methylocystis echinoides TaxID=29468 RepID=A0A9W6GWG0_9HYPH|nr:hypothetical protein [Methylocystis echinoides]GLI94304.1 hypothetical protein LMG27198_32960 [Methylocystis echinoides]
MAKALEIGITEAAALLGATENELRALARSGVIPKPSGDGKFPMVRLVQSFVAFCRDPRLSEVKAAAEIGVSRQWLAHLAAEGVFKRGRDGLYSMTEVWRAYTTWLRSENRRAVRGDADTAYRDAKRKKLEMEIAIREGELIETADAIDVVDYVLGALRGDLAGVPARATRDLTARRAIEAEIDRALSTACDRLARAAEASRRGVNILAEEAEVLAAPSYRRGRRKETK